MSNTIRYLGLDVHAQTIAVAVAEQGRDGEVRSLGTIPNTAEAVRKQKHYAQPAAVSNAATARVLGRLDASPGPAKLSAKELLQGLDEATLTKLVELLGVHRGNDQPAQ